MSTVQTLGPVPNFQKIKFEVLQVLKQFDLEKNQIMLQTSTEGLEDWFTGTGSLSKIKDRNEKLFKYIQPSLAGTEVEKFISHYNGYRARIMRMYGKFCYSIHKDLSKRIHVPIVTNENAWMVWPKLNQCHHLAEGIAYETDTTLDHTFFNASESTRIHLVMCI